MVNALAVRGVLKVDALDLTKQRIRTRLAALGMSANQASKKANLGVSYVNDILTGKSRNPVPHRLQMLADVLECDLEYLLGEADSPRNKLKVVSDRGSAEADAIPVFVASVPDAGGFFELRDRAPPLSVGSRIAGGKAYGVIVSDDSNAPRYFAGETVIVSPDLLAYRGFALLRFKGGKVAIRRIESVHPDHVTVSSVGRTESVEIARDDIERIEKIVASIEASF